MTTCEYVPTPRRNAPPSLLVQYDDRVRREVMSDAATTSRLDLVEQIDRLKARRSALIAEYVYAHSWCRARLTLWRLRRCEARLNQALLIRQAQLGLLPPAPEGVALMERPLDDHLDDYSHR